MSRYVATNLQGKRFGLLTVIEQSEHKMVGKQKIVTWKCKCDCGNIIIVDRPSLTRGFRKSCGHLRLHYITAKGCDNHNWKGYEDICSTMFTYMKYNAKIRNIDFDITIEDIWNLFIKQNKCCALTGVCLHFKDTKLNLECTASLDRINSEKGYVKDNVQWVHKDINKMKNNLNEDKFIDWCYSIVLFRDSQKKLLKL